MENIEYRSYARSGFVFPSTIMEIAKEAKVKFYDLESRIRELKEKGTFDDEGDDIYLEDDEIFRQEREQRKEYIKAIIFLHAFLESYFYDYAGAVLGDGYTKKFLEKLDTLSKIAVIPKLITGKEIDRSKSFWVGIKDIVTWRNKLIHYKTFDAIEHGKRLLDGESNEVKLLDLEVVFAAVKELFEELNKIDPAGLHLSKLWSGL